MGVICHIKTWIEKVQKKKRQPAHGFAGKSGTCDVLMPRFILKKSELANQ